MNGLPDEIFRRWGHSFEEDEGDVRVYRPAEYDFPRARGRAGIEFRPDGTFIDWVIGPGDATEPVNARWQTEAPGRVVASFEGEARPARAFEIVEVGPDVLKLREVPALRPPAPLAGPPPG